MAKLLFVAAAIVAFLIRISNAHPGEHHDANAVSHGILKRNTIASEWKRSLETCQNSAEAISLNERAVARRAVLAQQLREELGLTKRMTPRHNGRNYSGLTTVRNLSSPPRSRRFSGMGEGPA